MAPILPLLLSLLIVQEAAPAPEAQTEAPAPAAAPAEAEYPIPPGAPEDDYGLVAWCYGALDGHMKLYDKVLPEVTRIENEIAKIPGAPAADMNAYKEQRDAGRDTLKVFRGSMEAAEKASAKPIASYGAEQLKRGSNVWYAVRESKDKKYLAREWMSWGLPGRCVPTAEKLASRSKLFGSALSYNAKPPAAPATSATAEDPVGDAAVVINPDAADPIGAAVSDAQADTPAEAPAEEAKPEETPAPDLRGPQ